MDKKTVKQRVSERYARAITSDEEICCPTGYDLDDLRTFIPEEVLRTSYGCGASAELASIRPGETVLDIGSGGGIDCFDAARRVGPTGRVIGVDMTDEMLALARRNAPLVAAKLAYPVPNVEFRKGHADSLPVEDATVDHIISNCVINLAPDKNKVFQEMYRTIRSGGRFTILDIVADQGIPNYLFHDTAKWGDCLSGALPTWEYLDGLAKAGFLGVHQVKFSPWKVIDGIHFFSLALTGYKLPPSTEPGNRTFATLSGPFSRVVDELGQSYRRAIPEQVSVRTAQLLTTAPLKPFFLLSDTPAPLASNDPRLKSILPADKPCVWKGDYAILTGPFAEAEDDDHHVFRRGIPLEICSKTLDVLGSGSYREYFSILNRATDAVSGKAVSCDPDGDCC
jgi:arsenite methyltransferase